MKHKFIEQKVKTSSGASVFQCSNCAKRTANLLDETECKIDSQTKSTINRRQKYERKVPQTNFKEGSNYWFH